MTGIKVSLLLQLVFQWMVAAQVEENVGLPSNWNSSLPETNDSPGYVEFPEIGFAYKMSGDMLTYNEARKRCLNETGQLAVTDSTEKIEKILDHFSYGDYISVGLVRVYGREEWTTVDGKSTNNLPWATGEPSGDTYNCVYLSRDSRGLRNENCGATNRYLCEIALPSK